MNFWVTVLQHWRVYNFWQLFKLAGTVWGVPRIPAYVMGKKFFVLTEAAFAPNVICTTSEYAANIHAGGSLESWAVWAMIYTHFCGN